MSSTGTGGGLALRSWITSSTRRIIGRQSSTQRRTSARTCSSACDDLGAAVGVVDARDMNVDEAFARLVLVVAGLGAAAR